MTIDLLEALVYTLVYESVDEKMVNRQLRIYKKLTGYSYKRINNMLCSMIDRTCWSYKHEDAKSGCYTLPFDEMDGVKFHELDQFIDDTSCRSIEHQRHIIAYNNR